MTVRIDSVSHFHLHPSLGMNDPQIDSVRSTLYFSDSLEALRASFSRMLMTRRRNASFPTNSTPQTDKSVTTNCLSPLEHYSEARRVGLPGLLLASPRRGVPRSTSPLGRVELPFVHVEQMDPVPDLVPLIEPNERKEKASVKARMEVAALPVVESSHSPIIMTQAIIVGEMSSSEEVSRRGSVSSTPTRKPVVIDLRRKSPLAQPAEATGKLDEVKPSIEIDKSPNSSVPPKKTSPVPQRIDLKRPSANFQVVSNIVTSGLPSFGETDRIVFPKTLVDEGMETDRTKATDGSVGDEPAVVPTEATATGTGRVDAKNVSVCQTPVEFVTEAAGPELSALTRNSGIGEKSINNRLYDMKVFPRRRRISFPPISDISDWVQPGMEFRHEPPKRPPVQVPVSALSEWEARASAELANLIHHDS